MIAVVDYGAGNLGSVDKALRHLGVASVVTSSPDDALNADAVILPGVGAFQSCMEGLKCRGLDAAVRRVIEAGRPFLGICIGMQMLFEYSEEGGAVPGLGVLRGSVRRFPAALGLKVPHMGWNTLRLYQGCPLWQGLPESPRVYFVHSYYPVPEDPAVVAAETEYGLPFCSAVYSENVFATQFHPEKSGAVGLAILRNFARLIT